MFGFTVCIEFEWRARLCQEAIDLQVLPEDSAAEMPFNKTQRRSSRKPVTNQYMFPREDSSRKMPFLKLHMMTTCARDPLDVAIVGQFESTQPFLSIKHHQYTLTARQAIYLLIFGQLHVCKPPSLQT